MNPGDLDTWMQRGGRGGRGGIRFCRSTLLVEPSAVDRRSKHRKRGRMKYPAQQSRTREDDGEQEIEERHEEDSDDGDHNEDEVEVDDEQAEVLWTFITTDECLWNVIDQYYGNPPHEGDVQML
jgi:hypothetical protein